MEHQRRQAASTDGAEPTVSKKESAKRAFADLAEISI
jgi:hypothetical protein